MLNRICSALIHFISALNLNLGLFSSFPLIFFFDDQILLQNQTNYFLIGLEFANLLNLISLERKVLKICACAFINLLKSLNKKSKSITSVCMGRRNRNTCSFSSPPESTKNNKKYWCHYLSLHPPPSPLSPRFSENFQ